MKSKTTRDFWKCFHRLLKPVKLYVLIVYRQGQEAPFQPSLHFKTGAFQKSILNQAFAK
jgi:hypothetical protein